MIKTQPRALAAISALALASLGVATSGAVAPVSAAPASTARTATSQQGLHPTVSDYVQMTASATPPT
jgi:hypothetical protein